MKHRPPFYPQTPFPLNTYETNLLADMSVDPTDKNADIWIDLFPRMSERVRMFTS